MLIVNFVEISPTTHENLTLLSETTLEPFAYMLFDTTLAALSVGEGATLIAHKL